MITLELRTPFSQIDFAAARISLHLGYLEHEKDNLTLHQ